MQVTLYNQISSNSWSLSLESAGEVVTGLNDLAQQVMLALSTNKGSVPFAPERGFNISNYIDKPVSFVIPNGKLGILDTIANDVPGVTVDRIEHELDVSHVTFNVFCSTTLGNFVVGIDSSGSTAPFLIEFVLFDENGEFNWVDENGQQILANQ